MVVIISKIGCGHSSLGQAHGNAACHRAFTVCYTRLAVITDGSYYQHMDAYKSIQPLIVDDFMATSVTTWNAVDLFENMVTRERRAAASFASQLGLSEWYLRIEGDVYNCQSE